MYLNFYAALSNENLARLMHDFSTAKLPAYTAAESLYLEAINALPHTAQPEQTNKHVSPPAPPKRKIQAPLGLKALDPLSECSSVTYQNDSDCLNSSHGFSLPQTPTRKSKRHSLSRFGPLFDLPPPPTFNDGPKTENVSKWDLRATKRKGLIKTSSGTLLEDPEELPRSSSSMHLPDFNTQTSFQPIDWSIGVNDVFEDRSLNESPVPSLSRREQAKNSYSSFNNNSSFSLSSVATPMLSPIAQSERSGSPTPRRPSRREAPFLSPLAAFNGGTAPEAYSSPSLMDKNPDTAKTRFNSHVSALRTQLHKHIIVVQHLKTETIQIQADRTQRRTQNIPQERSTKTKLPQSRSFWSFKDPQAEDAERAARIEEGRARAWKKVRKFEPERYIVLAEEALAELRGGV